MAEKLELVRGYDFQSDQGTVSLLGYTDGFNVAYDGWTPKTKLERDGRVREALTLRVEGTATDDIAAHLQALAQKERECAQYYDDAAERYAVWFRVQLDGESNVRQSLVYELAHEPASSVYTRAMRESHHLNEYRLGIERAPWWEAVEAGTITAAGFISALGGTLAYSDVAGDLPARIAAVQVNIETDGTAPAFPRGEMWIGFKSDRFSPSAGFDPYIPFTTRSYDTLTGGTVYFGGGTIVADAAAKDGTATAWGPYATTDRVCFAAQQVGGSAYHGDYLVLMRAKITGTSAEAIMQMQSAMYHDYYGDGTAIVWEGGRVYPRVYLSAGTLDAYKFYEMGVVSLSRHITNTSEVTLALYSQTYAGTPTLAVDGLYLVPTEALVRITGHDNANVYTVSTDADAYAYQSPDDRQNAEVGVLGGQKVAAPTPTILGGIPPGDGVMVFCAQRLEFSTAFNLRLLAPGIRYFERWQEMRGDD